ncbi:MAG: hypothetical protein OXH30_14260, partial [Chloroflexi bacterium]|nr:hypothetical protein [Chloroflexota bacterium]
PLLDLFIFQGQLKDGLGVALPRQTTCHGLQPPCFLSPAREPPALRQLSSRLASRTGGNDDL